MVGDYTKHSSHIATRDPVTGNAVALSDDATLAWSSAAQWNGIVVELHRFGYLDTPEFYVPDHLIVLRRPIGENDGDRGRAYGRISLLPAQTPRRIRHGASEMLVVALAPEFVAQARAEAEGAGAIVFEELHAIEDAQIERIVNALEAEADGGFRSGRVYGESMGTALAAHLISRYSSGRPRTREHTGGLSPCRLRRVLSYIDENLAEDVCLDALARIAGLSQHRFAHNFKRETGQPPHQFVIRRRIERAKPLLRDTDETIATVTYALGFSNPSRFTYLFRRETGLTPSRYRKSFR